MLEPRTQKTETMTARILLLDGTDTTAERISGNDDRCQVRLADGRIMRAYFEDSWLYQSPVEWAESLTAEEARAELAKLGL